MINTVLEQVKSQKYFYRNFYRKAINILIILLIIEGLLASAIFYVFTQESVPQFYASSSDGILTPLTPMSEPNRSGTALLQ